jgi:excisionase family DNA binding protein
MTTRTATADGSAVSVRLALAEHTNIGTARRVEDLGQPLRNLPMTVKDAARFLGVSPQTVYLWVERKQIPHLRVMGRNIRFLRSDLEPFRAQFKEEVANGETA